MHRLTLQDVQDARLVFEENEPRDLFYRVATELVDLALRGITSLSVAEALAVLLQTWNREYYRFRPFDNQHFEEIVRLLNEHQKSLASFRDRKIESYTEEDEPVVQDTFDSFERVLGPVGAAKSLHLLAPYFFPLWDRAIAKAYHLSLQRVGMNAERYTRLIVIVNMQAAMLGGEESIGRNPLKAIDEYNYCRYSKQWIGDK